MFQGVDGAVAQRVDPILIYLKLFLSERGRVIPRKFELLRFWLGGFLFRFWRWRWV